METRGGMDCLTLYANYSLDNHILMTAEIVLNGEIYRVLVKM